MNHERNFNHLRKRPMVVDVLHGNVSKTIGLADFYDFVVDIQQWIAGGCPALTSEPKPFEFTVSSVLPFSKNEGLCFNFVSWVLFKKLNRVSDYSPDESLYSDADFQTVLDTMHSSLSYHILNPIFHVWCRTEHLKTQAKIPYPFPSVEGYHSDRECLKMYVEGHERVQFLQAFRTWYEKEFC